MNLKDYLSVTPEIQEAIDAGKPVVALESTILSHGMPYPQNVEFAHKVEEIVRAEGAVPATTAIMGGKLKVGLNAEELLVMCKAEGVGKVSRRDVAVYLATGMTGATTVATTMIIASMAGIRFFATGGIGGVHRGAEKTMDISADLQELANTPVCVVCAGAKSILDLGLTLEYLETQGVPVLGLRTDELPAFYCRTSGFKLDYNCKDEETVAKIMKAKWDIGLKGGAVVGKRRAHPRQGHHAVPAGAHQGHDRGQVLRRQSGAGLQQCARSKQDRCRLFQAVIPQYHYGRANWRARFFYEAPRGNGRCFSPQKTGSRCAATAPDGSGALLFRLRSGYRRTGRLWIRCGPCRIFYAG